MWQPAIESRRYGRFRPLPCFAPLTDSILIGGGHHSISAIILQRQAREAHVFLFCLNVYRAVCLHIKLRRASERGAERCDEDTCAARARDRPRSCVPHVCWLAFDLGVSRICATTSSAAVSVCCVRYAPCLDAIFNWSLSASSTIALTLERSARA